MKKVIVSMLLSIVFSLYSQQMEIPAITKPEAVIVKENYTLQYNEKFEQADWVAYELTKSEVLSSKEKRLI